MTKTEVMTKFIKTDNGEIQVPDNETDPTEHIKITSPLEEELHIEYYSWVEKFSRYKNTLLS